MIQLYSVNTNGYDLSESRHVFDPIEHGIQYTIIKDREHPDRYYKMLPHKLFDAPIVVYCDANMTLVKPDALVRLCKNFENTEATAMFFSHPDRQTSRQEIVECISRGLLTPKALEQYNTWRREGFEDNIPLMENNVIIRKAYDPDLQKCEEVWYTEYSKGLKRDQPSLPYAIWKSGFTNYTILEQRVKEDIFKWRPHTA